MKPFLSTSLVLLLQAAVLLAQDAPAKADCEDAATRLKSLLSIVPKDADGQHRAKSCLALRDEAGNQLRLSIAVEKSACEGPAAKGLTVPQKALIERRTTASNRLLDMMRECDEVMKAADSVQPRSAPETRKPAEITSCVIYKQSWDDRQLDKRFAAIHKADPQGATCKAKLPEVFETHCDGAKVKAPWPQQEFNTDLADLIRVALEMRRCEAILGITK
ncbi:MAG: hypothetical protein ABI823_02405 [Bryobacteraceae bacterium]